VLKSHFFHSISFFFSIHSHLLITSITRLNMMDNIKTSHSLVSFRVYFGFSPFSALFCCITGKTKVEKISVFLPIWMKFGVGANNGLKTT